MTSEPADHDDHAPVLVLGLGNLLLRDDGVGLTLLARLRDEHAALPGVEWLDGGTQGLALLGRLAGRRGLLVLDAVALGDAPGTVHVLPDAAHRPPARGASAHESSAGELLAAAHLLGDCPPSVTVVGVEPSEVRTGMGLSVPVRAAVPEATAAAARVLRSLVAATARAGTEATACTS